MNLYPGMNELGGWPVPKWSYISAHVRARFGLRVMETKWWSEPGETPRKSDLVLSSHIADQVFSRQTKHNLIIVGLNLDAQLQRAPPPLMQQEKEIMCGSALVRCCW